MLAALLASYRLQINQLVTAWLEMGAHAITFTEEGKLIAQFPPDKNLQGRAVSATLPLAHGLRGEIAVYGLTHQPIQTRLQADAALLAQLVRLEHELDEMTSELIEHQDQLLAFYDLTQSMRQSLEIERALRVLAQVGQELLKAEAAIALYQPPTGNLLVHHSPYALLKDGYLPQLFRQMQAQGQHIILSDPIQQHSLTTRYQLLLIPIQINGQAVAGLGLLESRRKFASPDLKLAKAIADQASAHLENVLLHQSQLAQTRIQTEMELARAVQLSLLPQQLPQVEGLDIYGAAFPAWQVGGDFYDFVATDPNLLTFTVGDVSGKGVSAALLMSMTRTVIRNTTRFFGGMPAQLISRANNELYDDLSQLGMFVSLFVGVYDAHRGTLLYANAGHSPVIYCTAAGKAQLLMADGTPLGVLPTSLAENYSLALWHGDVLLVGTDGFSEALRTDGERFGYERLLQFVEEHRHLTAQALAERLIQEVAAFSVGTPQEDDQTLVVIKGV